MQTKQRHISPANGKSKSEKFPPRLDGAMLGYPPLDSISHHSLDPTEGVTFSSMNFSYPKVLPNGTWSGPLMAHPLGATGTTSRKKKHVSGDLQVHIKSKRDKG